MGNVNELTDKVLFEMRKPKKVGRKGFNHADIAMKLRTIDEKTDKPLSTRRVRQLVGCSARLIRQVRKEMGNGMWGGLDGSGMAISDLAVSQSVKLTAKEELEFDDAIKKATGRNFGFLEWLTNNMNRSSAKSHFNFCKEAWQVVGSPSIAAIADRTLPDAANFANAFLQVYGKDKKRLRRRKKWIRQLMRCLGRNDDINEEFFKMREDREPTEIRKVPQIGLSDFPTKLNEVIEIDMREKFGLEGELLPKLKLETMMRTGKGSEDRELWGIKRGANGATYLVMNSPDDYQFKVKSKGGQDRAMRWLSKPVREMLFEIYNQRKEGEPLFKIDVNE
jgi:hypothetical protein